MLKILICSCRDDRLSDIVNGNYISVPNNLVEETQQ